MLLWFVGTSVATVWIVFRDPTFRFRLVVLGALLPDVVDGVTGARVAHSVVSVVVAMGIVMGATFGRKPIRKAWLAVVIGLFLLHRVMDGQRMKRSHKFVGNQGFAVFAHFVVKVWPC